MFLGEFHHSLDDKGRLIMPAKFREALGDGLVVTKGVDPCLQIFTLTDWASLNERIRNLPDGRMDARQIKRLVYGGASEGEITKQGRLSIPQSLREYADLGKDIVIVGVSDRLEIWSEKNWQKHVQSGEGSFAEMAERLTEFGL